MRYVLITGITSGIGAYLLKVISQEQFTLIGTYRKQEDIDPHFRNQSNIHLLSMDVSDSTSVEKTFDEIRNIVGTYGLYAVINNAGIAVPGPITHVPLDKLRMQFEVNFFGIVKIIQMSFDLLRLHGKGSRIINIGSVSGIFASPFLGAYASSKFALRGLNDSLRRELRLFGIKVILIQPGPIKTPIWKKNLGIAEDFVDSPYSAYLQKARDIILNTEYNALPLEKLKNAIMDSLIKEEPSSAYLIHKNKWLFYIFAKLLPVPLVDYLVYKNLNSDKNKMRPV